MEFSNKNIKPTLNTPTKVGKQLDTNFKKEIRKTGMNLKEEKENKHSLKKKIFKLDKMETLVHTDEFLSQKFDETKGDDPETIWGYHWNEVVLNSLFNDYVLNSPKYLQKYKNTRAKTKTRRGEEGIKQLQNDLKKEKEATAGAESKTKELMGGAEKEKVDELFGFGSKNIATELPMNKRSKNDTYFVDMAKKRLIAPVPYNSTPEEKQAIIQKYVGQPNIKQISWYNAVKQGIQGVPTEVPDGSIQQMDAEIAKKYPQGTANMVSLAEYGEDSGGQDMHWGMHNRTPERKDGMDSSVLKGSAWNVAQAIEPTLSQDYLEKEVEAAVEAYWTDEGLDFQKLAKEDFWEDLYYNISDIRKKAGKPGSKYLGETTGAASAGAFSAPLGYKRKEISETTTSASSGQYSGPRIWAKSPESSRFAHKPAWKGGEIVSESVIKGNKDYLTEAKAFRVYILKNEIIDMLNESFEMGEAESFQQHSEKMLAKLQQYAQETPELSDDPDFQELIKITSERAGKPQQQTGTLPTQTNVSEHHLSSKQDKIDFILKNTYDDSRDAAKYNIDDLNAKSDEEINALYLSVEKSKGISEDGSWEAQQDLRQLQKDEDKRVHSSIVFMQGEEADVPLEILNSKGEDAALEYLKQWDYGDATETTVGSGAGRSDSQYQKDNYLMSWNDRLGYIGLERIEDDVKENNYTQALEKDLKYTGKPVRDNESTSELESQDGLFKGRWNENLPAEGDEDIEMGDETPTEPEEDDCIISSNGFKLSVSCGGKFIGEFTEDSDAYEAVAAWKQKNNWFPNTWFISDHGNASLVDDHGNMINEGTLNEKAKSKKQQRFMGMVRAAQKGKLKDPSAKVAKAAESMTGKDAEDFASTKHKGLPEKVKKKKVNEDLNDLGDSTYVEYFKDMQGEPEFTINGNKFQYVWAKYPGGKVDIGVYDFSKDLVYNYFVFRNMYGLDESFRKLNESKIKDMNINKDQYKDYLKKRLTENAKTLATLNEGQKKDLLKKIHEDFVKESMIDDQPDSMINNQETSIAKSMDSDELNKDGVPTASAASPVGGVQQEGYDTDDINAKSSIKDKLADYSDEEPAADDTANDAVSEPVAVDNKEKQYQQVGDDPQVANDAEQFRQMLKAKFGVDSVSELSPLQRQQLMKTMNFGAPSTPEKSPVDMDFSQFANNDAQKAEYKARDEKRLSFLAHNANRVNDISGYMTLAKEFKDQTGENMFHPMAILASIEQLPQDSIMRNNLSNIEKVLRSQMTKKIAESIAISFAKSLNEERKPSSILNIEKLGNENAKNFKKDSAQEDALDQKKTYPKEQPADSIQKAAVYPNPKDFYIDQDVEKVNKEAKSMADIEKEVLAKTKGEAFNNVGNSTNEKGNEIPKRNLSKEEAYELAMNRGDGMQNIVYDNKPSERFEKRMEADMGKEVYKNREEKMEYRADMPMYNKDTQPTAGGDKKEENNKFKMGYNNESVTAKYRDEFGKVQLVEFAMKNVVEVTSIAEDAVKLNIDGMGNKYSLAGKKINENAGFKDLVEKYSFYMTENKVVAIEKNKVIVETKIEVKGNVNESFNKMKHLMNYKPSTYVDTKNSVKF